MLSHFTMGGNKMKIQETWSVPPERIREFLLSHKGVQQDSQNCFLFGQCSVELVVLPESRIASVRIPRKHVVFEGEEKETETLHRRFVLQFLSAGG